MSLVTFADTTDSPLVSYYFDNMTNVSVLDDSNSTDVAQGPTDTALIVGSIVMAFALIGGIVGNILVMIVVIQRHDMSNVINMFIVSLCVNDILNLGINNMMVLLSYVLKTFPSGLVVCELATHFTVLLMGSSLWHTGLIAVHRLIVVCFNTFYKRISKRSYTIFVLVFARVVPLLFLIQPNLGTMAYYEKKLIRCIIQKEFGIFTLLVSVVLMMIPSCLLILCYIAIFIKVYQTSSAIRTTRKREWLRREIQITKMFGMVFLLIMIGYLPYGIVRAIDPRLELSADFYVGITVLYAVANSANPIVYGVMDRSIRIAIFRILHFDRCCPQKEQPALKYQESVKSVTEVPEQTDTTPLNNSINSNLKGNGSTHAIQTDL